MQDADTQFDFNFAGMLKNMDETENNTQSNFLNYRKPGNYRMRVLPPLPNKLPYLKKFLHWIDRTPVLCLNQPGPNHEPEPCPICLVANQAYREDDREKGGKFRRKERYLFRVVDRVSDSPMFLDVPKTVYDSLFDLMTDEDWNILDPFSGRDVVLTKSGEGLYTKYTVKASPSQTPIFDDTERVMSLLHDELPKLKFEDTLKFNTREEVLKIVEDALRV